MSQSLIIVESPAKARTLQKYLGKNFTVKASVGHIIDLPVTTLGVDIANDFAPQYVTIRGKGKIISDLKSAAEKADTIYLAPDPDREGEAIAHHIAEILQSTHKPIHRVLFHELTKKAILAAIDQASEVNQQRFEAQQTRRILDRLVGYQISPLLWDKVRRGLSAGRVQSVAVRMVCEREQAIEAFVSEEYWSIHTTLEGKTPPPFVAQLDQAYGKKIDLKKNKIGTDGEAQAIVAAVRDASFLVESLEKKKKKRNPSPPFITSTMQMDANRKLRFSAKKTMTLAQRLYEGIELGAEGPTGLITYMRTDSTRISNEALEEARGYISETFGEPFLPAKPNIFKTSKSAQDAHEAIRPTDVRNTPEKLAPFLEKDMLALYSLIWKRFLACQMAPAEYDQTTITLTAARDFVFKTVGSIMRFQGFMALYEEAVDESASPGDGAEGDNAALPDLKKGETVSLLSIEPKQHFTQPPPRYTEATLVKALEENGVGRPSTYASILSTIQEKEYALLAQRKFMPTDLGKLVNELLVAHFPDILDIEFTASMEEKLDEVEAGNSQWLKVLQDFYGPFSKTLDAAKEEMKSIKKTAIPTDLPCPLCDGKMVIKWGKNGEFLACEKYPECKHTQDFTRNDEGKIVPVEREQPADSGELCEKCGKPMVFKNGRYGKFLACSGYPACKNIRATTTGVPCPEPGCTGELIQKISKRGKIFYSCNQYPKCSFALWDRPVNEPCPQCGSTYLLERETKKSGLQLHCPNKECGYTKKIGEEE
ncbi:MAG: type I DNA topoisomerase [Desulfurivibrionaceae bacterium]|jgi:DNA topoisomerase-1|nr:type I DNA topoisomerase [Pseudomonadota bacterium]MCG2823188.1 type I DNA topoisomerase [Desulfobulbaceae bacterium]MDP2001611.1 type I DNA topoisomerase [Desulfurivibrionaceae bacterium]MBU4407634.1 type I DNA topoisomerase [Pseudomonadota bacterium]MBU4412010.1 type I DNA topoisomerase [Pseudomonadota bacterium]